MEKSLFHKGVARGTIPTPYELIEPEIVHLKKGYSIRHGNKPQRKAPPWLVVIGFLGLAWLYLMDPFIHAWYKGEAVSHLSLPARLRLGAARGSAYCQPHSFA